MMIMRMRSRRMYEVALYVTILTCMISELFVEEDACGCGAGCCDAGYLVSSPRLHQVLRLEGAGGCGAEEIKTCAR
jgi:hypothetical protein